jgi:hypothetical protein
MLKSNGIGVLGVCGFARSGKDTFCSIAKDILAANGINAKQYSFAEQLKKEVEPFLRDTCKCNVWTDDSEVKKDMRDFLVWYSTTWWRKRDPKRWIRHVDLALKNDDKDIDIALVSDVRYPNEAEWVHAWGGYLVHVAAWRMAPADEGRELGGHDDTLVKTYFNAPNEQERINDPICKGLSDYNLEWEAKGLTPEEAVRDKDLHLIVLKSLNACPWFTGVLYQ